MCQEVLGKFPRIQRYARYELFMLFLLLHN